MRGIFKYAAPAAVILFLGVLHPAYGSPDQDKGSAAPKSKESAAASEAGKKKEQPAETRASGTEAKAVQQGAAAAEDGSGPRRRQRGRPQPAEAPSGGKVVGFTDRDRDGRNDLFRDANGDGVNDVDSKPYAHRFAFVDADKDGVNDKFVDADGDGVNDLNPDFVDEDGDGVCDNVIDFSGRFINDITGMRYSTKSLRGYKFGFINEERREMLRNFIDEDADGIPDLPGRHGAMGAQNGMPHPGRDRFIDRDGDGIDDRRQRMEQLRKGHKQ
ncbi:hypothetical protein LLH00_03465 [bacterium]|nr:hypothetical protein [bacterium]